MLSDDPDKILRSIVPDDGDDGDDEDDDVVRSSLSDADIDALQGSDLSIKAPFLMRNVSNGMFSVARHYGGAKFQGFNYTYNPEFDELVRSDVLKFLAKLRRKKSEIARSEVARLKAERARLRAEKKDG